MRSLMAGVSGPLYGVQCPLCLIAGVVARRAASARLPLNTLPLAVAAGWASFRLPID
jgi:hypothetical protein